MRKFISAMKRIYSTLSGWWRFYVRAVREPLAQEETEDEQNFPM